MFQNSVRTQLFPARTLTTGATLTAQDSGCTFYLDNAGGGAIVLPANVLGLRYTFIVKTAPTTDWTITSAVADTMIGYPVASSGGDETSNGNAAGDVVNVKANAALPSDRVIMDADGTSWHVTPIGKATAFCTITG